MNDDHQLEPFWQAARDRQPAASADFMARVLQDALQVQSAQPVAPHPFARVASLLRAAAQSWLPMGGMAAAACTGVVIGLASGNPISYLGSGAFSSAQATTVELMPTSGYFTVSASFSGAE